MRSTSAGVIHVPRVRRMMWLNSWRRPPDRRRVDDRQELLEVVGEQSIEQRRVAVLERGEADVLLERVGLDPQVLELELDLLLDRQDPSREQAAQPERLALLAGKARSLVSSRLPSRAGPATAMLAGRPATMSSNGDGQRLHRPKYRSAHGAPAARFPLARRRSAPRRMFSFDLDAEAVMLVDHPEVVDYLDVIAHQRYGPRVAVPRLLRMLDRRQAADDVLHPGLGRRDVARRRPLRPRRRPRDRPPRVPARERARRGRGDRGGLPAARPRGARHRARRPADRLSRAVLGHELPDARRCWRGTGSATTPG